MKICIYHKDIDGKIGRLEQEIKAHNNIDKVFKQIVEGGISYKERDGVVILIPPSALIKVIIS